MDEHGVERIFAIPVIVAALLVIPVIVIEESSLGHGWKDAAAVVNWVIWIIFALELVGYVAVIRGRRLAWLRGHPLEVAIVVLTPPVWPASLQALRAVRALRLLRLLRVPRLLRRVFSVEGLRYAAVLVLLAALGGGAAFAEIEKNHSTWDGVWWAVTTMTTVGYGDVYPTTTGGRLLAIALMLVGIGFVALLTGAVAQRFLAPQIASVEEEIADAEVDDEDVFRELRVITERLRALEARLERQQT